MDGSGAIDVGELQGALGMLGVAKSEAEVEELMAGVNENGSGEAVGWLVGQPHA